MSKRTNSIVAVTIAKYATIYVEADSPQKAREIVGDKLDEIYDEMASELEDQFEESEIEIDSYESYATDADDYMNYIWADGEAMTYDEYIEELEDQNED